MFKTVIMEGEISDPNNLHSKLSPKIRKWQFTLVDSDFTEKLIAIDSDRGYDSLTSIIECYERRNINPVPNLLLYIKELQSTLTKFSSDPNGIPIKKIIANIGDCNTRFQKYKKDVEKYLILI